MSLDTETKPSGPLRIPTGRAPGKMRRLVVEKLRGHVTSELWLPADSEWPALADLRDEQLRHRDQVAVQLDALHDLEARFRKEDADQAEALREAYRNGSPDDVDDDRTSPEDRTLQIADVEEKLWAAVTVFGEFVDRALDVIRENEDKWLGQLRGDLVRAHERRQEAQRLLREASVAEWTVHRLGEWLLSTSDDGPLSRQPAPKADVPAPREFQKSELTRPWHRAKPPTTAPEAATMPEIDLDADIEPEVSEMVETTS